MSAAQPSLFTGQRRPTQRVDRGPGTADAEAMARPRQISVYPLPGALHAGCWANRPSATPLEAIDASLRRIGRDAGQLVARRGANPDEVELRLRGEAKGLLPHHLLAVIAGLTLDEASTALARRAAEDARASAVQPAPRRGGR